MRKIVFTMAFSLTALLATAQFTYKIKADTVKITNDACSTELILENSTKDIKGFLYNEGNGRTKFQKGLLKIDDTTYIIGADTLKTAIDKTFLTHSLTATSGLKLHNVRNASILADSAVQWRFGTWRNSDSSTAIISLPSNPGLRARLYFNNPGRSYGGLDLQPFGNQLHTLIWANSYFLNAGSAQTMWSCGDSSALNSSSLINHLSQRHEINVINSENDNHGLFIIGLSNAQTSANRTSLIYDTVTHKLYRTNSNPWSLTGNTGTNPTNDFVGTTDAQRLVFKTNNAERATITSGGDIGIGTASPGYKLDVNGTARVTTLPFISNRDTILTYDPVTKQLAVTNTYSRVLLASDVINNNATANTIQDVTGLSFPVTSGVTYKFRFFIIFTSAATTTGSRWTINGPSASALHYFTEYTVSTSAVTTVHGATSYNLPAGCNTGTASTGSNLAVIEGVITPSANGTVIARFASEIASSAITAKGGVSYVEFQAIN